MWGELSSECGARCLLNVGELFWGEFLWRELSWGELSLGRVVLVRYCHFGVSPVNYFDSVKI